MIIKARTSSFLGVRTITLLIMINPFPKQLNRAQFSQADHNDVCGLSLKIIDGANNLAKSQKKESFWKYLYLDCLSLEPFLGTR